MPNDTASRFCTDCAGRGFLRTGDFADRAFPRCAVCRGLGLVYLNPVPEPRPGPPFKAKAKANDDMVVFFRRPMTAAPER